MTGHSHDGVLAATTAAMSSLIAVASAAQAPLAQAAGDLIIHPAPQGIALSPDYKVRVNGREAPVYAIVVNPTPEYRDIPGPGAMISFDFDPLTGPAIVEVEVVAGVRQVRVRPLSRQIEASLEGNVATFRVDRPGQFFIEVDGSRDNPLFVFANPLEAEPAPDPTNPNVIYFGPGVHHPGRIEVGSHQTLYLAGGAWVNAGVMIADAENVVFRGRGILHGGEFPRERTPTDRFVHIDRCRNVRMEGVILLDPYRWAVRPLNTVDLDIDNIKIIGWRRNSDGIDPCNSQNVRIRNSFIKAQDDGVSIKGIGHGRQPVRNITVENMVMWNNWMRAFVVGGETRAEVLEDITFRDSDILFSGFNPQSQQNRDAAMGIWNVDHGTIRNVTFENIRLEEVHRLVRIGVVQNKHSRDVGRGRIENIVFRDIFVTGGSPPVSEINGHDETAAVEGIRFVNIVIHGQKVRTSEDLRLTVGPHVSGLSIEATEDDAPPMAP